MICKVLLANEINCKLKLNNMLKSFELVEMNLNYDENNWDDVIDDIFLRNAKDELLTLLKENNKIKCAFISYSSSYRKNDLCKQIILKTNYTLQHYEEFLNLLDFNYYSGYGSQELFGTIWFEDGTWLNREEYDGSEWWEHFAIPTIPEECKNK